MRWMLHADEAKRALLRGPGMASADTAALTKLVGEVAQRGAGLSAAERAMFLDLHVWLPDDILTKVDRMSMAVSLEARTPFLDHRLVEYVAKLPHHARIRGNKTKIVLRDCLADLLPASVLQKPKEGFSIPMKNWLRNELRAEAEEIFDARRLKRHGFLDADGVRRLWTDHLAGRTNHAHVLFAIIMFEHWYDAVIARPPAEVL